MEGRLQFKHDYNIYKSKEEIQGFLDSIFLAYGNADGENREALRKFMPIIGEPVVFRYKNSGDTTPHLVLGVGVTQSLAPESAYDAPLDGNIPPKYALIDFEAINGGLQNIDNIFGTIDNLIDGLGFEDSGAFNADKDENGHIMRGRYFEGEDANVVNYIKILHDELKRVDDDYKVYYKETAGNAVKVEENGGHKDVYLKLADDEEVLRQDSGYLKSTLRLFYDATGQTVYLYGFNNDSAITSFSTSDFVKNELLRNVDVISTVEDADRLDPGHPANIENMLPYLYLEWNTSDSDESGKGGKVARIQLKNLVDIYKAGDGLSLENGTFSVKVDDTGEFLSVSQFGVKVSGITDAITAAANAATTKIEVDEVHKKHILMSGRTNDDGSKTYTFWEDDIASDSEIKSLISSEVSGLESRVNDTLDEMSNDFSEAIIDLNSAITKNSTRIQSNKTDIEKLKDFAEYNVGKIDGEVIATVVESNRDRIETLESKADSAAAELPNKVDKVEGKGLSTNDYTNEEKALLATVSENAQENVIETIKVNGTALVPDVTKAVNIEVPFKSLADDEKILTLNNDGILESMFSVDYDTNAKKIFFYGKTDQKLGEIDVTEFLIDGMIRSVNIVTEDGVKYLKFIFNTDAGNREIKIALTDLVTEYTVSGGSENYLVIDDFKIGLKVDQPDYSGLASGAAVHDVDDKYSAITHSLEDKVGEGILDDSGNTISLTHKINGLDEIMDNFVDENKLEFDEDFKIAGIIGTLGTGKWKNGDVIPAGTKVMDVLKDILQQRLLPEGVQPTATIKLVNPSPVEVGTVISPVYEIKFSNGVYNYADGTTGATLIGVDSASVILLNNGSNTPNTSTAYPNGTFSGITASDGMNLSVMANISYSSSYVPKDNLGTDVPEKKIPDGMLEFVRSENTITSYRPMFYGSLRDGDIADYDNITSQEVLTLLSKATGETVNRIVVDDEAEVVVIMIPVMSNKEVKKIIDTDSGFDLMDVFERHQTVVKTYEGEESATTSYYVYVYDPKTQIGENVYRIIYNEN